MEMAGESVSKLLPNSTVPAFDFRAIVHGAAASLWDESRFRLFCKKSKPESAAPVISNRQEILWTVFPNRAAVFSLRYKVFSPRVHKRQSCARQFVPTIHAQYQNASQRKKNLRCSC